MNKFKKYTSKYLEELGITYIYYDNGDYCWNTETGDFFCEDSELPDYNWKEYTTEITDE